MRCAVISIDANSCRIIHFTQIKRISLTEVLLVTKKYELIITGENLKVYYLDHDEIIIHGDLKKVEFHDF